MIGRPPHGPRRAYRQGLGMVAGFVCNSVDLLWAGTHTAALHWHVSQESPLLACGSHSGPLKAWP